jgi:AraC-like DNA-binding protein
MLLRTTTLPLSEIAAKVGIMDQSYFARKFKQYYSITPSEYRQKIDLS